MYDYLQAQEASIREKILLAKKDSLPPLLTYLSRQIEFLQHERLVHLLITLFFAVFCLASFALYYFFPLFWFALLALLCSLLEFFYILHYYHLENGVQRLYTLYNEIYARCADLADAEDAPTKSQHPNRPVYPYGNDKGGFS